MITETVVQSHLDNTKAALGRVVTAGVALNGAVLVGAASIIAGSPHPDDALSMLLVPMWLAIFGAAMGAIALNAYARLTEIRLQAAVAAHAIEEALLLRRAVKAVPDWAAVIERVTVPGQPTCSFSTAAEAEGIFRTRYEAIVRRAIEHEAAGKKAIDRLWQGHGAALVFAGLSFCWFTAEHLLGKSLG